MIIELVLVPWCSTVGPPDEWQTIWPSREYPGAIVCTPDDAPKQDRTIHVDSDGKIIRVILPPHCNWVPSKNELWCPKLIT